MNILLTGGLGYIGSYLIDNLPYHRITVVDNLYTQRYCSLSQTRKKFTFLDSSFSDISVSQLKNFDIVIHMAAIVDAANSFIQKDLIEKINVVDSIELIKKCEEAQTKFIFPSSTSIYGTSKNLVSEYDIEAINPQSPYAEAKVKVEEALSKIHSNYVVFRFGTVCGVSPGIRFQTTINKFCYQATFQQPLTVWQENYEMVRPYLAIQEIGYTINMMLNKWSNDNINRVYNVLTDNISLKEIINIISCYIPNTKIQFVECPLLNQFSYKVDNSSILRIVRPKHFSVYDNIPDTLQYLRVI